MATTIDQPQPVTETANPVSRFLMRAQVLNWEAALYLIIFILAVFTRFYILGDRVMSHDESLHTRYSYNLYADGNFQHTPLMHGPILFHVMAFFYFLFGDNDFTARIYAAALGVIIVMMPYLFRRWLGRTGALLVAFMLLISPITLYYHRYIREDTPAIFYSLLMFYSIMMYTSGPDNQRRRSHWLFLLAAAMIGNLGSKETAFIYIAIFGIFLALYWFVRLGQRFWNLAGRMVFQFLAMAILLAGVAALGLYIVWSVAPLDRAVAAAQLNGWFGSLDSSSLILWTMIVILAVVLVLVGTALWAFRGSSVRLRWSDIVVIVLIGVVVATGLMIIEELSHLPSSSRIETAIPAIPGQEATEASSGVRTLPLILAWVGGAVVVLGVLATWRMGWWETLREFPEFDVMVVIGTLILPWATPFIITAMGVVATDYSTEGITRAVLALIPMMAISITVGLAWDWRRWLICAVIFHAIFVFFFTTMFTNINGLATGMIGSLGYWLEQQGVRRGSQPQYYYLALIMPFYEFLPVIGSTLAMFSGVTLFWKRRRDRLEAQAAEAAFALENSRQTAPENSAPEAVSADAPALGDLVAYKPDEVALAAESKPKVGGPDWLGQIPFLLFVSWWGILNLVGYTLAGEKMPWLATHLTLPLILLSGWYFGRVFDRIDWRRFREGGWLYLLLLPLLLIAGVQVIGPFLIGPGPFAGLQQSQLVDTGRWLAVVAVSGFVILGIYQLVERTGWRHLRGMFAVAVFGLLSLLTARSAFMASYINYDMATEYLVYAHAAPAVKTVLNQIEELSLLTTDGRDLSFSYDNEVSWPYSWYFRNFPNARFFGSSPSRPIIDQSVAVVVGEANRAAVEPLLEDRFYRFEYIRLWWPMQDYFNLTPERLLRLVNFSPDNTSGALLRQGLFEIWWSRDYTTYGQAVGRNFRVTQWPVSDRMHFYVRKDIAAQIWNLGVGEGTVENPLDSLQVNACNANWQLTAADLVLGTMGAAPGQLNRPIGMAIGPDGSLYVAEESNNRISVFSADGTFQRVLGSAGEVFFTRPNSVAVGPDGNLYVADTWNFQIQVLSPQGEAVNRWGERGEYGLGAQTEPVYGFWGPRDVVVDAQGRVYVADTGNKRVRVYTATGEFIRDIGSGGSAPGQLDEPSGLALHPDGRLFVADYWNRRVSVFNTADATFMYTIPVRGWYDEQGNRPYLAVDPARDLLYVSDPDAGRVLVYNTAGECLGSFGQASRESFDATQFRTTSGMAVGADGSVFVADAGTGRVLRFRPFQTVTSLPPDTDALPADAILLEITEETTAESEATAELEAAG
jgi:predicted membrane-bound mannosyltransferase/DNA-binding beta-propeller fold protein YncE